MTNKFFQGLLAAGTQSCDTDLANQMLLFEALPPEQNGEDSFMITSVMASGGIRPPLE